MTGASSRQVLLAFVRGDADWRDVDVLQGVSIELAPSSVRIEEAAGMPTIRPRVQDFAEGVLRSLEVNDSDWARVVLALNCVDFASLEDAETGEQLLEAIWDLAEGTTPNPATIDLARRLAG